MDRTELIYGNAIAEINKSPITAIPVADWTPSVNVGGNSHLLSENNGNFFTGGIGSFVGVDAIDCEVSLNILFRKTPAL